MRLDTLVAIVAAAALPLITGCDSKQKQEEPSAVSTAEAPLSEEDETLYRQNCPVFSEDVTVAVDNVPGGIALTFRTDGDVDLLRERVERMALTYSTHRGHHFRWDHMPHARHARGSDTLRRHGGPMVVVDAKTDDVDGGAMLTLKPERKGDLESLRTRIRLHQKRMASGQCWRLRGMGQQQAAKTSNP
jgi:hypothetical protein